LAISFALPTYAQEKDLADPQTNQKILALGKAFDEAHSDNDAAAVAALAAPPTTVNGVWVNTRSGKYWKPEPRYYGKTKEGEFMPELEAFDRGYSPAGGTGQ
jgi:hypothetical protein